MTILDELIGAARGCLALLVGNRQAASHFDFRQTGLVGSLIALVIGLGVSALGPQLLGVPTPPGMSMGVVILGAVVVAVQFGAAFLVLRQLGRGDGFVPFVVVQNWVTLFQTVLSVVVYAIFGQPVALDPSGEMAQFTSGTIPFLVLGIASLVVWINLARLILTLRPMHVALFVVTQLGAAFLVQAGLGTVL